MRQPKFYAGGLPAVFVGNSKFLAAVTATGGKHATAVGGCHSLTETVLVDPLAARGLESSFHSISFFIITR